MQLTCKEQIKSSIKNNNQNIMYIKYDYCSD